MSNQIVLSSYAFCEESNSIIPFSKCKKTDVQIWDSLMPTIHQVAQQHGMEKNETPHQASHQDTPKPETILLFLKSRHLNSHRLFKALLAWNMRSTSISSQAGSSFIPTNAYWPVISISLTDITSLHTEEKGEKGQKERNWNELTYKTFRHDSRIKFLDSSIWHRFVPIQSIHGTFENLLNEVLLDIKQYHDWGLYYSNAANVTLEFQLRMLKNSYIAKMGDRGHAEVVTPFKFHSEGQMKRKALKEGIFLTQSKWYDKDGNPNTTSLMKALDWRLLIVDDQATIPISSIYKKDVQKKCKISKKDLIIEPFKKLDKNFEVDIAAPDTQKENDIEKSYEVIAFANQQLKTKTYDIIFLDYLLGFKKDKSNEREYGFNFLKELLSDNRKLKPDFRRDFSGKYWIFPISSFPHALLDKLTQLGISHLHEIWHISQSGGPISTPHLFAHNLYRFIKQKISDFFLYPTAFRRFINQSLIHEEVDNIEDNGWIVHLEEAIKNKKSTLDTLNKLVTISQTNKSSPFINALKNFITHQSRFFLEALFNEINVLLKLINTDSDEIDKIDNLKVKNQINKIKNTSSLPKEYLEGLEILFERIEYRINEQYRTAEERIKNVTENQKARLSLNRLNLEEIPLSIKNATKVTTLLLGSNKLKAFPSILYELKQLEELNLSNNPLEEIDIEKIVTEFIYLKSINLKKTKLPNDLQHSFTIQELKKILKKRQAEKEPPEDKKYHVGLSFAGENRKFVKKVKDLLEEDFDVFYDEDRLEAGDDFEKNAEIIYGQQCQFVVPFISKHYKEKNWTRLEWDIIIQKTKEGNEKYIIPVRLDTSKILGLSSKYIYITADEAQVSEAKRVAQVIKEKILKNS